ncbi:MAG TPA: serine hydroxymethyltransferase [Firmicutes bacterium]|nr:serine hydroxymethyltransferase [Bacillota bacterium]
MRVEEEKEKNGKQKNSGKQIKTLAVFDPQVARAVAAEMRRQQDKIILIASENYVSQAVLQAQGSILTNKYAEGYPGARFYGGCENMDVVEELARSRAAALFAAEHVNVQPHAGAVANLAVYLSVLKPGDRLLGMELAHGGHLTHGSAVNVSGKYYQCFSYRVDPRSGYLDMDEVRKVARRVLPRLIIAGASSYSRIIDFAAFARIADEVGALFMVDMAHIAGMVAVGLHPSPVPHAHFVTSTTHKTLRGPRGGMILCRKDFARDLDRAVFPGLQGGPLMHIIAAKAVAFKEAQTEDFYRYQQNVLKNARALAEELKELGFNLVSGGTDNHLVLLDLRNKGITGQEAELLLDELGITANKNAIPDDPQNRLITSGLRLGTPAVTSRGMQEPEMKQIAALINTAIAGRKDSIVRTRVKREVKKLVAAFPVYQNMR